MSKAEFWAVGNCLWKGRNEINETSVGGIVFPFQTQPWKLYMHCYGVCLSRDNG